MEYHAKEGEEITDYLFDISECSWMTSYEGRTIFYSEESPREMISSDYVLDLREWI